jgi:hypothetical protein
VAAIVHEIFDLAVLLGSEEQFLGRYANAPTTDPHHTLRVGIGAIENCANRRLATDTPHLDKSAVGYWKDNRYEAGGGEINV